MAHPGYQNPGADIGEFTAHRDRTGHHVWYRLLQGNGLVPPEARVSRVPHLPDIHRRTDVRQPNACRSDQMHDQSLNASRCGRAVYDGPEHHVRAFPPSERWKGQKQVSLSRLRQAAARIRDDERLPMVRADDRL